VRLFVALTPPAHVLADVDAALEPVRKVQPDLRWIPVQRWHLTLAFYGEVADERLDRLRAKVARQVAGSATLDLALRHAGRFGDRVLWVGVGGSDRDGLRRLGTTVSVEDRAYRPHLTVARVRGAADLRPLVATVRDYEGPSFTATEVTLVRSRLGPAPTYDDIASWPLEPRT
jgi:RNA 2',3'-cyclic 3'-phosphodiesterase